MESVSGLAAAILVITNVGHPGAPVPTQHAKSAAGTHVGYYRRGVRYLPSDAQRARSWRGDGIPAPETRQQRRYAARCRGAVTGRTIAVLAQERADAREEEMMRRELVNEYHRFDTPIE